MFKFIISLLVTFIAVPAMAQVPADWKSHTISGWQYATPEKWVKVELMGITTYADTEVKATPNRFTMNWQAIEVKEGEDLNDKEFELLKEGISKIAFESVKVLKVEEKEYIVTYQMYNPLGELIWINQVYTQKGMLCFVGTFTFSTKAPAQEANQLFEELKKLTPVKPVSTSPKTREMLEIEIEDIRDLIDVKETKLNRMKLLDDTKTACESLTIELEELGLKLRKLERQVVRLKNPKSSLLETLKGITGN